MLQENGTRSRHDRNGLTPNLSSRHDAWQAVIAFQEVIKKRLRRRIFIAPVICGTTHLAPRLVALGKTRKHLMTPPTAEEIAEEVGLFTPGPVPAAPALVMPADVPEPEYSYRTDQLVVQHADVINVYHNHPGTLPTR